MNHCSIEGCETPIRARGMCEKHYRQTKRAEIKSGEQEFPGIMTPEQVTQSWRRRLKPSVHK